MIYFYDLEKGVRVAEKPNNIAVRSAPCFVEPVAVPCVGARIVIPKKKKMYIVDKVEYVIDDRGTDITVYLANYN